MADEPNPAVRYLVYNIFAFVNFVLHAFGCYLLVSVRRQTTLQHIYLLNISAVELCKNTGLVASTIIILVIEKRGDIPTLVEVSASIGFVACSVTYYLYFSCMVLVTIDRFMHIVYPFHPLTHSTKRAKVSIAATWFFCFVIYFPVALAVCLKYGVNYLKSHKVFFIVGYGVPSLLNAVFLVFVIVSYIVIAVSYKRTRKSVTSFRGRGETERGGRQVRTSVFGLMKQFNVAITIVVSYILLLVVPTTIFAGYVVIAGHLPHEYVRLYIGVSLCMSDTIDGVVYIFLYGPVRRLLKNKMKWLLSCCQSPSEEGVGGIAAVVSNHNSRSIAKTDRSSTVTSDF